MIGTPESPLWVDTSTLKAVAACHTQAGMRYHLGYTSADERSALKAGTAIHEALAVWFRGGSLTATMAALAYHYQSWAEANVPPADRLAYPAVASILNHWCVTHPLSQFPVRIVPTMVEVGAQAPLVEDGSILFVGRMDKVGRDSNGWMVGDIKTTGMITSAWLDAFELDPQLTGYVWLLQQHIGEPVKGAFITAIELPKLPTSTKKCEKHAVSYTECKLLHAKSEVVLTARTPEQIESWRWDAVRLAKEYLQLIQHVPEVAAIHAANMRGRFNRSCMFCEFKGWCKLDRPIHMVESLFVQSPWLPYSKLAKKETP